MKKYTDIEFVKWFSNDIEIIQISFTELSEFLNYRKENGIEYLEGILPKDIKIKVNLVTEIVHNNSVAGYEPTNFIGAYIVAKEGDRVRWNSGSPASYERLVIERGE